MNTGTLWDDFGIASFDLCGSVQPLWNTYYYMKEALKTQKPKVMVVDMFAAVLADEYSDHSRIIKNNYGLKFSEDKINSVKVSAPKEKWIEYLLEYPTYHSRYGEIYSGDFRKYQGMANEQYWKGFGVNTATEVQTKLEGIQDITGVKELAPKTEEYLMKIIRLSKSENIPLLFVVTPYPLLEWEQKIYNRVAQIAEKEKIPFVNYNLHYDEMGLDFSSDFADGSHLNHRGNVKFTKYLGNYLKTNYEIPDRREDDAYQSNKIMADDCRQRIYNQEVKEIGDIGTWLDKIQNENYLIVYTIAGGYKNIENYAEVNQKLMSLGIYLDSVQSDSAWVMKNRTIIYQASGGGNFLWHQDLGRSGSLMLKSGEGEDVMPVVNFNNVEYKKVDVGLNVFVYDLFTESLVESAGFNIENGKMFYEKR